MKPIGWMLCVIGLLWLIYSLNIDISVPGFSGMRVNNIGLMSYRQNNIIISCFVLVVSAIFLGMSYAKKEEHSGEQINITPKRTYTPSDFYSFDVDRGLSLNSEKVKEFALEICLKTIGVDERKSLQLWIPVINELKGGIPGEVAIDFEIMVAYFVRQIKNIKFAGG
ncbi:hypothetical protein QQF21_17265 [Lelliottia sp. V89_10]|uniref:hypothetical protein n=1 Tax=Lelliottia wanjuensis TaxID=3050585 RepID=UPI00249DA30B|nr:MULTISPECIES: hypothetical protein [unclassified Lelliottia]MDI3359783.1 hypothetical protein [Lelliottia sp. V89_13]MDK9548741.1 hypothetical protein [Lelliottia sp. V89_5]MDK9597373.1 hypothetical protein [Lelliottia sp. V89_10]